MLLGVLITIAFSVVFIQASGFDVKPCSFPVPLDLPYRNERADQCWLRIEDDELVETLSILCYVAHDFLRSYIHDYNAEKMRRDDVNVALWSEEARPEEQIPRAQTVVNGVKDWKLSTVLDPITHKRLYVTKNAECRLIMYTRDGTSNYKIHCETLLFYVNERIHGGASRPNSDLTIACIFLVFALSFLVRKQ